MRGVQHYVSVPPYLYLYLYLYRKSTFSVSVSSPLPLIRSYRIEFYFSVLPFFRSQDAWSSAQYAGNSPAYLLGLPRHCRATRPGNGIRLRRLWNGMQVRIGFYENGYGNRNVMLETRLISNTVLSTG